MMQGFAKTMVARGGRPPQPPAALDSRQVGEFDAARAAVTQHAQECTAKEKLCAELYVLGGNKVEAYRQAYDIADRRSAHHTTQACAVLSRAHVVRYVRELERAAAQGVMVDVQELIASDLAIVKAAPYADAITWHEIRNCRHCYGIDGGYQWIDANEYAAALAAWMDAN